LRSRIRFGRYRGRQVSSLSFALPDSFSTVPRASGLIFMFCAPGLLFGRYRGRRVPFSYFVLPDSFRGVSRASGTVFKFFAPGLVFDGTEGVGAHFHVFLSRILFGRHRGRRGSFSSFALQDTFLTVPRASGPVFMFCAPRLIFESIEAVGARFHVFTPGLFLGVTEGAGSRFHVLRSGTRFERYRGRRVPISCFALPDSFSTVSGTLGPVGIFCAPGHAFGCTKGIGARFNVLRTRTRFRRYQGHRGSFSYFALPDSFWAVPWPSGLVFKFCAPGHVFGGIEGVGSRFHVLRSPTRFLEYRSRRGSI
jgi:hypothetical protein